MNEVIENKIIYDEKKRGFRHRLSIRLYYLFIILLLFFSDYFIYVTQLKKEMNIIDLLIFYFLFLFVGLGILFITFQMLSVDYLQILNNGIRLPNKNILDILMNKPTILLFENILQIDIDRLGPIKIIINGNKRKNIFISRDSIIDLVSFINSLPENYKSKYKT